MRTLVTKGTQLVAATPPHYFSMAAYASIPSRSTFCLHPGAAAPTDETEDDVASGDAAASFSAAATDFIALKDNVCAGAQLAVAYNLEVHGNVTK